LQIVWRQNTARLVSTQGQNVAGTQKLRLTFTVDTWATSGFIEFFNGAYVGGGDVWWDDIMVVEGNYTGDYVDGAKPLAKWNGTADASTSVGYPQQFLDIAGKPALDQAGVGNTPTTVAPGFAARTFYAVYEVNDNTLGSWQVPFSYGIAYSSEGFTLQTSSVGVATMSPRADFATGGGSTNAGMNHANARATGRIHVVSAAFNEGLTLWTGSANGSADGTRVLNSGTVGWTSHRISVASPAGNRGIRGLVFWGEHDRATRLAMMRYLGNKYGAYVA
jgi:hypothetical protein